MRTLVDLLNDDRGYVRIFEEYAGTESVGFGYEKSSHAPMPLGDLFDRMSGYDSMEGALEAARLQLSTQARRGMSRRATRKPAAVRRRR